ncbi:PLP-dependent aminotransferase family protein [Candidimonas humi]|uniref:PLP-dependent aminotransferase family protein n=1 Tax=Candidimonas humi TaxID=683355 RepID=A0ABV8NZR3_9BURK|nr:PLP-dependent aminotransferase family protein [Candidimonas humi]MBV6306353.1 PLP-dependent aminotransferase family protein [Candidimonas humi]
MNSSIDELLAVDAAAAEPLYRQLYARLRGAIADGALRPGGRIPSSRALAKELGVARGTVETAYALLEAEGYIQGRGQAGTVVSPGLRPESVRYDTQRHASAVAGNGVFDSAHTRPFQMGLPALDAFPRKIWARLGARLARGMQARDMSFPDPAGLPALRSAIAAYLRMARGVDCDPAQVFVTAGYHDTLQWIVRALLRGGDQVWVEDPGYPATRSVLKDLQLLPVPVPVDAEGLVVERGMDLAMSARAAVVTPAHQSPLCVSLSLPRRLALLDWAARRKAWIVEDDYDGEYRYRGRPLPALASLDRHGRVLYAGTFSKVLFPGIRLAYLVVPEARIEDFMRARQALAIGVPQATQAMVAAFMEEGHFVRHIQRMRKLYGERRSATAAGLSKALGPRARIDAQPGGMHLVLRLDSRRAEKTLVARMLEHGMYSHTIASWCAEPAGHGGLMLGFTNIASQGQAEELGARLSELMQR